MAALELVCVRCGESFARRARGPVPKYCSAVCRARACDDRASMDGRLASWQASSSERRRKDKVTLVCPHCEVSFESNTGRRKHCGAPECRAKWHSKRMQPYVHARRAAKAGVGSEGFEALEIYERDNWTCWICGGAALRDAPKGDPLGATLDHVVPLAKGGPHSRANVRCAHLECNLRKGDRIHSGREPREAC